MKWKRNVGLNPIEIDGALSIILFKHVSHGRFTVCRFKQHQCVVTFVQIIRSIEVNIVYHNKHTTLENLVNNLKTRWREATIYIYSHKNKIVKIFKQISWKIIEMCEWVVETNISCWKVFVYITANLLKVLVLSSWHSWCVFSVAVGYKPLVI